MKPELVPTPSQTVGPYLHIGLTDKHSVTGIASPEVPGERLHLKCRVLDLKGKPVPDAMIEIWQADASGKYHCPDDFQTPASESEFRGFGRAATDENGACEFETVRPGRVPGPDNTLQAPHLNLAVYARGILLQLYTRVYFAGDVANEQDPVLALVPADRRHTLIAQPVPTGAGSWTFEIRLCGDEETVFFDL
jgi:protocatechuate 3,4-dioxygenase, alpha subunit